MGQVTTRTTNLAHNASNLKNELEFASDANQASAISKQEAKDGLSGMRINLDLNQMRRANDQQKALGAIG